MGGELVVEFGEEGDCFCGEDFVVVVVDWFGDFDCWILLGCLDWSCGCGSGYDCVFCVDVEILVCC